MSRRDFGTTRALPSGRVQARYTGPDGQRRTLGSTFSTKTEARKALAVVQADIIEQGDGWRAPGQSAEHDEKLRIQKVGKSLGITSKGVPHFGAFAKQVLALRAEELAPQTLQNYESILRVWLLPTFEYVLLSHITVESVDQWWAMMAEQTGKVTRRNAYFVISGIMKRAVRYKHITASPCVIENAGKAVAKPRPFLSMTQFKAIVAECPEELHAPLWTLFGAHARLGELLGLNRGDVNLEDKTLVIERQVQDLRGGLTTRGTKTGNQRTITMLQPTVDALTALLEGTEGNDTDPLFLGVKGGRLSRGYLQAQWKKARDRAGLPEAHIHDIRHLGLTLVAAHASTKEVMHRGGHTTASAALKYQHATAERDAAVAAAASASMAV